MIKYYKLWRLLDERGMKRQDLKPHVSAQTLAKMSKGQNINMDSIDKICAVLDVQPGDIMEHIREA